MEVVSDDGQNVYATLSEGAFFGEIALLFSAPRTASIRAADYCDIYVLDKRVFDLVLQKYPEFEDNVRQMANERQNERRACDNKSD